MNALAAKLNAMMSAAYRERMQVRQVVLSRGLKIRVYVDDDSRIHLMILRSGAYPSLAEWKAVLMSMPKVFETVPEPQQSFHKDLRALHAVIPTVRPDPFNQVTP